MACGGLRSLSVAALAVPMLLLAAGQSYAESPFDGSSRGAGLAQAILEQSPERPQAGGGRQGGGRLSPEQHHAMMQQKMGLTDKQMAQMKALREKSKAESQQLRQALQQKRHALMQYIASPGATEAGAMNRFNEVNAIQRRLGELRVRTWFEMRKNMSPEQLEKLQQMQQHRQQLGPKGEGGGRGGMRGFGTGRFKQGSSQAGGGFADDEAGLP